MKTYMYTSKLFFCDCWKKFGNYIFNSPTYRNLFPVSICLTVLFFSSHELKVQVLSWSPVYPSVIFPNIWLLLQKHRYNTLFSPNLAHSFCKWRAMPSTIVDKYIMNFFVNKWFCTSLLLRWTMWPVSLCNNSMYRLLHKKLEPFQHKNFKVLQE